MNEVDRFMPFHADPVAGPVDEAIAEAGVDDPRPCDGVHRLRCDPWAHRLDSQVLGVDSSRGSPFNVQRSLHIPSLTKDEVVEMFRQYQTESGQVVDAAVVDMLFESTRGQPGLVGWLGELLTEKYNPGKD